MQKGPKPRVIVRRNGGADRWPRRKVCAPPDNFRLARKDAEVTDTIDDVATIAEGGLDRIGTDATLCLAFLRHSGLRL